MILLFDLDGTLIDSIQLILESAAFAFLEREREGLRVPSSSEWLGGVGRPLATMFRTFVEAEGADDAVEALTARYRQYQMANHDRLVRAYPGVVPTLAELRARGHRLGVVTSKTTSIALMGLRHVGLADAFEVVIGCDVCDRHKPDPEPIRLALLHMKADEGSFAGRADARAPGAAYVGDSVHDMEAGRAAGIVTVGALWGPFPRATLAPAEPTHWADHPADLLSIFPAAFPAAS